MNQGDIQSWFLKSWKQVLSLAVEAGKMSWFVVLPIIGYWFRGSKHQARRNPLDNLFFSCFSVFLSLLRHTCQAWCWSHGDFRLCLPSMTS